MQKGRRAPAKQEPAQPTTIAEVMQKIQADLDDLSREITEDRASIHQKELRHSNLMGQLQAYASIQPPANPAEIEHGSE